MIYHVISRVEEWRLVLKTEEKERFKTMIRIQENFPGCQMIPNSLNDNCFRVLLEVPSMPEGGRSDEELLKRLKALYGEDLLAGGAKGLADARPEVCASEGGMGEAVEAIRCDRLANSGIVL